MSVHYHDDSSPCGLDCPVGPVRIHFASDACAHAGRDVCPMCAEWTDDETQAVRQYLVLLNDRRRH